MLDIDAGARFFDAKRRDVGFAASVRRRPSALTRLTVLDVTMPEASLATFLRTLDRGRLTVRWNQSVNDAYVFEWASGYPNGDSIRVQGILEGSSLRIATATK